MSISVNILTNPDLYSPANAEIWFQFNSASYSVNNFKYVVEVYELDGLSNTVQFLGTYKIPPRPLTGDGLFTPNKILKSLLGGTLSPTTSVIQPETNSIKQYSLNYGFQYDPGLTFSDTFISGTYTGLTFSTPHGLMDGDVININKDNKNVSSYLDGQSTIISVGSSYSFVIDKPAGNTSSVERGAITDVLRIQGQTDDFWAYNGTRQYNQIGVNFGNTYVSSTSSATFSFLEDYVGYKPIFLNQYETTQLYAEDINDMTFNLASYDSSFNLITDADYNGYYATGSGYISFIYPTGTKNLTDLGFDFTGATYYKLTAFTGPGPTMSFGTKAVLWRKIECNPSPFPNVRVSYMNRLGSYEYINFNYDSKKTVNISRTEYKQVLPWNYTIGMRGLNVLSQKVEESFTLNTNWMSEYDYTYFSDILTSPDVYIIDDNGVKYPILITDSSYDYKTYLREKLFNLSISVKNAYQVNLQNQ